MNIDSAKEILASSNTITTWSLSIIAASLLAILSTSYVRPLGRWSKVAYLIYIPGWIFLAKAIAKGNIIGRSEIMATLNPRSIDAIIMKMNDDYTSQLNAFYTSLVFWGVWLLLFLLWWIFHDFFDPWKKPDAARPGLDKWVS